MIREIKFRAKTVNEGEWIYGMTISRGTIARKKDDLFMEVSEGKWKGIIPETLCQFTGLRDIKGNEIYDGDILDTKTSNLVPNGYSFICKWIESGFALEYQGRTYGVKESNRWMNKYPLCQKNVEDLLIMGNIYDNPELVKHDSNED